MSLQGLVMGVVQAAGSKATVDLVVQALSYNHTVKNIKQALRQLKEQGKITYLAGTLDQIDMVLQPAKPPEKQGKIWRAMRVETGFKVKDIETLSGAKRPYINKYLLFLIEQGFVKKTGKSGKSQCYIVTDKATATVPVYSRNPDAKQTVPCDKPVSTRAVTKVKITVQIGKKKMIIYDNAGKANIVFPDGGKWVKQNTLFASELCRISDSLKAFCMSKVTKH